MSTTLRALQAAIALNNIAINLMQRGCRELALKTFSESLDLMNSALMSREFFLSGEPDHNENDDFEKAKVDACSIEEAFHRASDRYAKSLQEKPRSCLSEIHVIEDQDFFSLRAAGKLGSIFPVLISEILTWTQNQQEQEHNNWLKMSKQLGIIKYNHGLLSLTMSQECSEGKNGHYLQQAHGSLRSAETIFSAILNQDDDFSVVFLSVMVLNGLSLVYDGQELMESAKEAQRLVKLLRTAIDDDYVLIAMAQRHTAAAA